MFSINDDLLDFAVTNYITIHNTIYLNDIGILLDNFFATLNVKLASSKMKRFQNEKWSDPIW